MHIFANLQLLANVETVAGFERSVDTVSLMCFAVVGGFPFAGSAGILLLQQVVGSQVGHSLLQQ